MPKARHQKAFSAQKLLKALRSYSPANAYIVGFSGGADSTALLHALNAIRHQLDSPISAVHVNHGLHAESSAWQQHCQQFCEQHEIELKCFSIELSRQSGKGLEAEARQLRYQAISKLLKDGATLLTAHHADDQAETLLLNLMRGSGVDGLSAMPERRQLGNGFLQRPLLNFENDDLIDYLNEKQIEWINDPSNQLLNQDRNFVRHEVIPLMGKRWPSVNKRLLRTCEAMTDARKLLEKLANEYLDPNLNHPHILRLTTQLTGDNLLFKQVTRQWTRKSGAPPIPARRLEAFTQQVVKSGAHNKTTLSWGGWLVRSYQQKLWLMKGIEPAANSRITWPQGFDKVNLGPVTGSLSVRTNQKAMDMQTVDFEGLTVTNRTQLSSKKLDLGGHHKSLKKLFQEAGIPSWLRDYVPVCEINHKLVAIGDWCTSKAFEASLNQRGLNLVWKPNHALLQYLRDQVHST